jgi:hypothetical protein
MFRPGRPIWPLLVPFVFAIAAAWWGGWAYSIDTGGLTTTVHDLTMAYTGLWLAHATLFLGCLWVLNQTYYRRRQGSPAGRWQFSIRQLLIVMTILAILAVTLRSAQLIIDLWIWVVILLANNVLVALVTVVIHAARWHQLARIAAMAGVALLLGAVLVSIRTNREMLAINLIHVLILFAWLDFGSIIPEPAASMVLTSRDLN